MRILHILLRILYININILIRIGDLVKLAVAIPFIGIARIAKWKPFIPKIKVRKAHAVKLRRGVSIFIKIKYLLYGFLLCFFVLFLYSSYLFIISLPSPRNIGKVNFPLSTHIFDRNDKLLFEIYHEQNRTPVKLSDLPSYVSQATIAIEDKDFYYHKGVSLFSGIFRAIKETIIKKNIQGGSTITQQLMKSALLTPDRTIQRKIKEMILALWAEQIYSKEQILEMYLNQVPYGGSAYGIEEGARTYFGKHASELVLEEAAFLAGLPQSPTFYSPYTNPDVATARRNEVLEKMYGLHYISDEQKQKAVESELNIIPPIISIRAPHFVFYTKNNLEDLYGVEQVGEGGLKVKTTLDLDIQEVSEQILKEELEKIKNLNVSNGAILVTRPKTGEILAMVGSTDYFSLPSGAFNVTTALRQPGSSIKPILYALALEKGYTAASIINDAPVSFYAKGSTRYSPVNYDGKFHGNVSVRYALANSYNVPAVKILNSIGVEEFVKKAQLMGISTWNDVSRFGLSLTLGGGEVAMVDMAAAYGALAYGGEKVIITNVQSIERKGKGDIFISNPKKTQATSKESAFIVSDILSDAIARQAAFGANSLLEIPGYTVAVKTGTTDQKKDNWTIGYTPEYLVAVWVGNNDNSPMHPQLTSGITGAAPIWNRVMTYILKTYQKNNIQFEKPEGIVEKQCLFGRKEYFVKGTEQKASCFMPTPVPTPGGQSPQ